MNLFIKEFDAELLSRVRAHAAMRKQTIREFVMEVLEQAAGGAIPARVVSHEVEATDKPKRSSVVTRVGKG